MRGRFKWCTLVKGIFAVSTFHNNTSKADVGNVCVVPASVYLLWLPLSVVVIRSTWQSDKAAAAQAGLRL